MTNGSTQITNGRTQAGRLAAAAAAHCAPSPLLVAAGVAEIRRQPGFILPGWTTPAKAGGGSEAPLLSLSQWQRADERSQGWSGLTWSR